jgi:hypothetical protein
MFVGCTMLDVHQLNWAVKVQREKDLQFCERKFTKIPQKTSFLLRGVFEFHKALKFT